MTDRIARMFPIAALCIVSAVALAACGGGGGKKAAPTPTDDQMQVMPAVDHPDTLGEALAIEAGQTVDGRIDSAEDRDFFRLPLTEASTVTFWTSGEADTLVALLDGEGNDLAADTDGRASVETELSNVYARVRGGPDGGTGSYRLHNEVVARAGDNGSPGEAMGALPEDLNDCVVVTKFALDVDRYRAYTLGGENACTGDTEGFKEVRYYRAEYTNQCNVAVEIWHGFSDAWGGPYNIGTGGFTTLDPGESDAGPNHRYCTFRPTSYFYCISLNHNVPGNASVPGTPLYAELAERYRRSKAACQDGLGAPLDSSLGGRHPPSIPPYREIRIADGDWVEEDWPTGSGPGSSSTR